ncbi:hypothetical protein D3C72_2256350 [compost metagenome]
MGIGTHANQRAYFVPIQPPQLRQHRKKHRHRCRPDTFDFLQQRRLFPPQRHHFYLLVDIVICIPDFSGQPVDMPLDAR